MPDHAKKLGELTKRLNTARETCEDIENVMDILDALGPVVEDLMRCLNQCEDYRVKDDHAESLLAAMKSLR